MSKPSDRITLERSQVRQGQQVMVDVYGGEEERKAGTLLLTYGEWIHFSKLLKEAVDHAKRRGEMMVEVVIRGRPVDESTLKQEKVKPQTLLPAPSSGPASEPEQSGDYAVQNPQLVRSLL